MNRPPVYAPPDFDLAPPEGWLRLAFGRRVRRAADLAPWAAELREALLDEVLRPPEAALRGSPQARPLLDRPRQGYCLRKLALTLWDGAEMPLWLLTPDHGPGPWPAVLVLPGHGQGARSAAGEVESTDGQNAVARELALAGFTAAVPELRTFGERELALPPGDWGGRRAHEIYANLALEVGRPLTALHFAEALSAWRWLLTRPEVAAGRAGVCGHSQGGRLTILLAAARPETAAAACFSGISSILDAEKGFSHAHDMLPGLLSLADYPDLAAAIAPRPLMLAWGRGETDPYWLECSERLTYRRALPAWELAGRPRALELNLHGGGHEYDVPSAVDFFRRAL